MNAHQEEKLNMMEAVIAYLSTLLTRLSAIPNFDLFFGSLQEAVKAARKASEENYSLKAASYSQLPVLRKTLVMYAEDAAVRVQAYARFHNLMPLLREVSIGHSDYHVLSHQKLSEIANIVYQRAEENMAALEAYGVNNQTQSEFKQALDNFLEALPVGMVKKEELTRNTAELARLFKKADESLRNIDFLIDFFRHVEPSIPENYSNLRKLRQHKHVAYALHGIVMDAETGLPLQGVKISLVPETAVDGQVTIKNTAPKGGFIIKTMPEGSYLVSLEKPGYQSQTAKVTVPASKNIILTLNKAS